MDPRIEFRRATWHAYSSCFRCFGGDSINVMGRGGLRVHVLVSRISSRHSLRGVGHPCLHPRPTLERWGFVRHMGGLKETSPRCWLMLSLSRVAGWWEHAAGCSTMTPASTLICSDPRLGNIAKGDPSFHDQPLLKFEVPRHIVT